jgi:hypothetical protein
MNQHQQVHIQLVRADLLMNQHQRVHIQLVRADLRRRNQRQRGREEGRAAKEISQTPCREHYQPTLCQRTLGWSGGELGRAEPEESGAREREREEEEAAGARGGRSEQYPRR